MRKPKKLYVTRHDNFAENNLWVGWDDKDTAHDYASAVSTGTGGRNRKVYEVDLNRASKVKETKK